MKTLFVLLCLFTSQAWAFDRLKCNANLKNFSIHTTLDQKKVLLNKDKKDAFLSRAESREFLIRNEKGVPMASITPWNSVLFLKSKSAAKAKYKMDFTTDDSTYFSLSMANPDGGNQQEFRCQFTF